ncbi:MAG: hypothetical protein PHP05_03410, partial [Sideroxydans sp.]|nr:hypothetical protein [Sideroxydans sp.]
VPCSLFMVARGGASRGVPCVDPAPADVARLASGVFGVFQGGAPGRTGWRAIHATTHHPNGTHPPSSCRLFFIFAGIRSLEYSHMYRLPNPLEAEPSLWEIALEYWWLIGPFVILFALAFFRK